MEAFFDLYLVFKIGAILRRPLTGLRTLSKFGAGQIHAILLIDSKTLSGLWAQMFCRHSTHPRQVECFNHVQQII